MAATTRWVKYDISEAGTAGTGGTTLYGAGTRGYSYATAAVSDTFDIGTNNNKLYVNVNGDGAQTITLASGTNLDPRFVAKDIAEKIHALNPAWDEGWTQAGCVWTNDQGADGNRFELFSGTLGTGSSITVSSGTNTAHLELGWGTSTQNAGVNLDPDIGGSNTYNGGLTTSGTYTGFFDEVYRIMVHKETNVGTPNKGGTNTFTGTITKGGMFDDTSNAITYTININVTNGTTMGAGTGNVPTMQWTSTSSLDDSSGTVELLYPDYWYKLGTKGVKVKFSDGVFNTDAAAWTIACTQVQYAQGSNPTAPAGTALYVWDSDRGDDCTSPGTTNSGSFTTLGTRGLSIQFNGTNNMAAGDSFYVIATAPQPSSYGITNLNYGNVTVSTESSLRCVMFEILSGAIEIDTVKFGLQANGSFSHHNTGNSDTYFRFGTIGPGNDVSGREWRAAVTAADISSDTPPAYLYATEDNLSVVTDADSSEAIGTSTYNGMVADPVWLNIKLGSSEVGANSTINYRLYFDYS